MLPTYNLTMKSDRIECFQGDVNSGNTCHYFLHKIINNCTYSSITVWHVSNISAPFYIKGNMTVNIILALQYKFAVCVYQGLAKFVCRGE